jgi:hypothetical protein
MNDTSVTLKKDTTNLKANEVASEVFQQFLDEWFGSDWHRAVLGIVQRDIVGQHTE